MTELPSHSAHVAPARRITFNGESTDTTATTLAELLTERGFAGAKVATAHNGRFVPAGARAAQELGEGDSIEVVSARQGG